MLFIDQVLTAATLTILVGRLLLRLRRGQRHVPHRQRDLPGRAARPDHRLFFAVGTTLGGTLAPWLFGRLIDTGSRVYLFYGNLFAAALLMLTVVVVVLFGVKAERTSLEEIAEPLSAVGKTEGGARFLIAEASTCNCRRRSIAASTGPSRVSVDQQGRPILGGEPSNTGFAEYERLISKCQAVITAPRTSNRKRKAGQVRYWRGESGTGPILGGPKRDRSDIGKLGGPADV